MQAQSPSATTLAALALIVEPTRTDLSGTDVLDDDEEIVRRVQVKSARVSSGMNPLKYSDATAIFKRMGLGDTKLSS
jgi:hypothetical protein